MGDAWDVEYLIRCRVARNSKDAGVLALKAGLDMNNPDTAYEEIVLGKLGTRCPTCRAHWKRGKFSLTTSTVPPSVAAEVFAWVARSVRGRELSRSSRTVVGASSTGARCRPTEHSTAEK